MKNIEEVVGGEKLIGVEKWFIVGGEGIGR